MPLILAEIDTPLTFTRLQSLPEGAKSGYYPGVLVIEKGPAKGHFAVKDGSRVVNYNPNNPDHVVAQKFQIFIGDDTLNDVVSCGASSDSTKCKLDHGATVRDIVGSYAAFRRDGEQVRADLTLMDSTPHRKYVEELFSFFHQKIGNSIDFDYYYEIAGDVAIARCQKLNSVDIVDAPAATKSLFSTNLNTPTHMPLDTADIKLIEGMLDTKFGAIKTDFETKFSTLSKKFEEGEESDEDKKKKDKEKDEEKGEMSAKMGELAERAALSAIEKLMPKAQREQLSALAAPTGDSPFEAAVKTQLAAGAKDRGTAILRISRDLPEVYNAHMKAGGVL